jgi:hypothetical protein
MIERWIETGRKKYAAWHQKIPAGLCVMLLAVLLAGIRPLSGYIHKNPDLDAIANEVGSISYMFYRDGNTFNIRDAFGIHADSPMIDHAGTRVLYCHTSDNGGAAYVNNFSTGERMLVFEEMATNFFAGPSTDLAVHSWSPDDTKFVYTRSGSSMVICDSITGKELAALNIWPVGDITWLTSKSFACVERGNLLHLIQEQDGGKWKEVGKTIMAGYACLTTLSADTIAWQEANAIVALNLISRKTNVLAKIDDKTLKEFSCSPKTSQLLITCTTGQQDSLWRIDFDVQMTNQNLIPIISAPSIRAAKLVNGGKGYAYVDQNNKLVVQADAKSQPIRLFEHGNADSFSVSADGQHWHYDVAANQAQPVIAGAERGVAHVHPVTPQFTMINGPTNRPLYLVIYKPTAFDPRKKYPLVIANTPYGAAQPYMQQYAMAVANAGGYFVILNRFDWFNVIGFGDAWSENEPYVINYLSQDPTIDRKRVFLVSNCVESNFLKDYAAKYPGTITGAIMLIANDLLDPANFAPGKYAPKLLISTCDTWEGKGERMKKFQETAAQSGVVVDYIVHPNTKHDFVSKESQRERIRAMLHLVFDN